MKKSTIKFSCIVLTLIYQLPSISQITLDDNVVKKYDSLNNYYVFHEGLSINVTELITKNKSNFISNENNKLVLINELNDIKLGGKLYRFKQHYKNFEVENSLFNILYNQDERPLSANGEIYQGIELNVTPVLSAEQALTIALYQIRAEKYFWQDSTMEESIKERLNNSMATYYPNPKLVILPIKKIDSYKYYLCFKVNVSSLKPFDEVELFIDANTAEVLQKSTKLCSFIGHKSIRHGLNCEEDIFTNILNSSSCATGPCNQGSAKLHRYGNQNIKTDKYHYSGTCTYRLKDNCTGTTLHTKKNIVTGFTELRENTNNWTNGGDEQDATTAHWSLERTLDYFRTRFVRNGMDGQFGQVNVYTNFSNGSSTDAFFNGSVIFVTKKYGFQHPFVFIDQLAHEFTHGITKFTCALGNTGESGAVNEGFSDIFGVMAEYDQLPNYSTGQTPNYIMGEHSMANSLGIRDISNPTSYAYPHTYNGTYWASTAAPYDSNNDQGGVHTNLSVIGFWFYLLAEGGSGINDNSDNYCVEGIGKNSASEIAWRTLTMKLTPTSNFANCRAFSIIAAQELFGPNSNEVAQLTQAWFAVGVGPAFTNSISFSNHIATGVESVQRNCRIELINFNSNSGSDVTYTSNDEVKFSPDFNAINGSIFNAFITPGICDNNSVFGARIGINQNSSQSWEANVNETERIRDEMFQIMPNPFYNELIINGITGEIPNEVIIYDVLGKCVYKNNDIRKNEITLDLSTLLSGIYTLRVNYHNQFMIRKIVKRN